MTIILITNTHLWASILGWLGWAAWGPRRASPSQRPCSGDKQSSIILKYNTLYLEISVGPVGPSKIFTIFHFLFDCFSILRTQDPKIRNLQVEICISTKRHQNQTEFWWFRMLFSFFKKRRVGPTPISRFSVLSPKSLFVR